MIWGRDVAIIKSVLLDSLIILVGFSIEKILHFECLYKIKLCFLE